jgi:hypothetical protein
MTRIEIVITVFRLLGVIALIACVLFLIAMFSFDTLGMDDASHVMQVSLNVAVLALVGAAGLQIVLGIPLWLFQKMRPARG